LPLVSFAKLLKEIRQSILKERIKAAEDAQAHRSGIGYITEYHWRTMGSVLFA